LSVLVVDIGTTTIRARVVSAGGTLRATHAQPLPISRPRAGIVEFDADALAEAAQAVARASLADAGPVLGVGIAAQRASTVLFSRRDGHAVGPGIGWEDLRTVGQCLALRQQGLRLAPNQSATKLAYLLSLASEHPIDDLAFGTVETFIAYHLTRGATHVSDATNAAVTGLVTGDGSGWDSQVLDALAIPYELLPTIVDSAGELGVCSALEGEPPLAALVGDQQASLIGQGCLAPGSAKITFGTGAMLDVVVGRERPAFSHRGPGGTFPIIARRLSGSVTWGLEAIMLTAGSAVTWLTEGLGLLSDVTDSEGVAASVRDAGGVVFVPALSGMGAPAWDFGARGAFFGLTGATNRAEMVRAVLEGIAQRAADLLEAAEEDLGERVAELSVDGGMSTNVLFCSLVASATRRPVLPSEVSEATTLGAAFLAGSAVGVWSSLDDAAQHARHRPVVEPGPTLDRARWLDLRDRARRTVPALSALDF
jgi:glycerol kinase